MRFGVYFDHILSLKNFKNYHFLYKKNKNCNFLYKINILDTRLLWGNYSREFSLKMSTFCNIYLVDKTNNWYCRKF